MLLVFHLAFVHFLIRGNHPLHQLRRAMHIREGRTSNEIITDQNFCKIQIERGGDRCFHATLYTMVSRTSLNMKIIPIHLRQSMILWGTCSEQLEYIQKPKTFIMSDPG